MSPAGRAIGRLLLVTLLMLTVGACASDGAPGDARASSGPGDANASFGPGDAGASARPGSVAQVLASLEGLDLLAGGTFDPAEVGDGPTVVWFWAPWCPNCRAMGPGLADLADQHQGQVAFVGVAGRGEVDEMHEFVDSTGTGRIAHVVDADGSVWAEFDVFTQPAFAFVTGGGDVELVVGRQTQEAMQRRVAQMLGS
jgi:thiol-disulfide isomerase/thioredoxin